MIAIVDTSSLVSLVRYYLPFDKDAVLFNAVKAQFEARRILMIDKVYDECRYVAKGIVVDRLKYLADKDFRRISNVPVATDSLIAPAPVRFLSQVDNNFVIGSQKNRLKPEEYEVERRKFLESADIRLVLLCLTMINAQPGIDLAIVTEETEHTNDNKLFRKIPAICNVLDIRTITLPEYLASTGIIVRFDQ